MRKLMSLALALVLSLALAAPAAAADVGTSGSTGAVPVTISAEATTFSVTVPTSIPLNVDASAAVTCADNLKIINNSAGPVEVTGISVQNNAWSIVSFNGGNRSALASEKVDSNELGLALTPDGGSQVDINALKMFSFFGVALGERQASPLKELEWIIPAGDDLNFECDGIATALSKELSGIKAVDIVFTISWKNSSPIKFGEYYCMKVDDSTYFKVVFNSRGGYQCKMIVNERIIDAEYFPDGSVVFDGLNVIASETGGIVSIASPDGNFITLYDNEGAQEGTVFAESFCSHENTELRNVSDNYTGYTYCLDCAQVISRGTWSSNILTMTIMETGLGNGTFATIYYHDGMTWADWIASDLNTYGFDIMSRNGGENIIVLAGFSWLAYADNTSECPHPDDIIAEEVLLYVD